MEKNIVIIGLGQLGRVFAGGFLRAGHNVAPVNRGDDMDIVAARHPEPDLVLIAVAESDLLPTLSHLPPTWKARIGLLQNELLPRDWQALDIIDPTVISVWFEKKKGMDAKPIIASPAFGPQAGRLVAALAAIDLPARTLPDAESLLWELVRKNLYILTTNIAGLVVSGDVGTLWEQHRALAEAIASDVLDIQDWLTGKEHERMGLMEGMLEAFQADPLHGCAGRSATNRLKRALTHANAAGLKTDTLRKIASAQSLVEL